MNKVTVTIQQPVEVERWEAFDGRLFDNQKDCEKYERQEDSDYVVLSTEIPQSKTLVAVDAFPFFCGDTKIRAMKIRNMSDVAIINNLRKIRDAWGKSGELTAEHIGTVQVFSFAYDFIEWHGTPEEMKQSYCDMIDRIFEIKE